MEKKPIFTPEHPTQTRMYEFMQFAGNFYDYKALHHWSITEPASFWETLINYFQIPFTQKPTRILNAYKHPIEAVWCEDAKLNYASILLQRQDDKPAIISFNETNEKRILSFKELYQEVIAVATGLCKRGIKAGDRVAAILPNIPETIILLLATSAIGAIFSSCSPDFGPATLFDRLGQIEPKILVVADGYQYQGKHFDIFAKIAPVVDKLTNLESIFVVPFTHTALRSYSIPTFAWNEIKEQTLNFEFEALPFNHPLYILFSSGTTGKPKCIMHGAGGTLIQHLKELALHTDLTDKDNLCFYSTIGWMMWNWMLSALALGTTITLYEGSPTYPTPLRLFTVLEEAKVTVFGTSAKFISTIQKLDIKPKEQVNLTSLRTILSTGSPLLEPHYEFVYQWIKEDILLSSISGGTDLVACFALGHPILPVYAGELQCLGLGMDVAIYNDKGEPVINEPGELVCRKPFPSMPVGFWQDPDKIRYFNAYYNKFPNVWTHGDLASITQHGGLIIYGRSDATLNAGGVRIGTAEIYRPLEQIKEIEDSVVIAQKWNDDSRIVLFVKLKSNLILTDELKKNIKTVLSNSASPRHVPAKIIQVPDIPKTINGKTMELAVRDIVHNKTISNIDVLSNPESLDAFKNHPDLTC